jgi:uncharacterized membrane protein YeaQ/YmgE (transglycosylase-associated protein family)
MEQILINLIAGAVGGVGAGKASPNFDLGTVGNIVAGLVGACSDRSLRYCCRRSWQQHSRGI